MRYLSRNKVYHKEEPFKNAKKIYIFCEGEMKEVNYFTFFQGFTSNVDIIPIPNKDGQSDPTKLKSLAERSIESKLITISKEYEDEVWFVIDTDRWNEGNKIEQLREYVLEKNTSYKGWYVAQSNPSFEIWLYYHFESMKPNDEDVKVCVSFKDFVNNIIKGGFDNRSMPIKIQDAVLNAENNFEIEDNQPKLYSTEVFNLGKQIIKFIKPKLDFCLGKLQK